MEYIRYELAAGRFDDAIRVTTEIIADPKYGLMTANFGTFINPMPGIHPITRNVIWDLHRPENKAISANKEALFIATSRDEYVIKVVSCFVASPASGNRR